MIKAFKELLPLSLNNNDKIYLRLKEYTKEELNDFSLWLWKEYIDCFQNEKRRHEIFQLLGDINYEIGERNRNRWHLQWRH